MPKFYQTSPNIIDRRFKELRRTDLDAHDVYLYLQMCRHRNFEGLFYLPKGYVADDLGTTTDAIKLAFHTLEDTGFIRYDGEVEVILDLRALEYLQPKGHQQITSAVRKLGMVPTTPLKAELLKLATIYAPDYAEALREAHPELEESLV